jgi:cytochrome c
MERDMFDTMTFTKILGAVCGTFLVMLLGKWAAEEIYHVGGHGHGDHEQAYSIEVESDGDEEMVEEAVDVAALMGSADLAAGEQVFARKCAACHVLEDGVNGTGPHLYSVVGRDIGSVDGYGYSGALVAQADVWGQDELFGFLESPKGWAPGTAMSFSGLVKEADRVNVIAYLESIGN